jgi:hypothetical protein
MTGGQHAQDRLDGGAIESRQGRYQVAGNAVHQPHGLAEMVLDEQDTKRPHAHLADTLDWRRRGRRDVMPLRQIT